MNNIDEKVERAVRALVIQSGLNITILNTTITFIARDINNRIREDERFNIIRAVCDGNGEIWKHI